MTFVFFGSSQFSIYVLEELKRFGFLPSLVVTLPDKPKGRKLILTPNPVKVWGQKNNVEVITDVDPSQLLKVNCDLFLVASYGRIIKPEIFNIPKYKTLNIHPSLLPKYRGASPMISQILNDEKEMGTSIMVINEGVDSGPVLAQIPLTSPPTPLLEQERGEMLDIRELEKIMAKESAQLFAEIIEDYLNGKMKAKPQDESKAAYCQKIKKEDGLLDLGGDPRKNLLKIKAFAVWPRCYFLQNGKRIVVTNAKIENSKLKILRVIPEGKKK